MCPGRGGERRHEDCAGQTDITSLLSFSPLATHWVHFLSSKENSATWLQIPECTGSCHLGWGTTTQGPKTECPAFLLLLPWPQRRRGGGSGGGWGCPHLFIPFLKRIPGAVFFEVDFRGLTPKTLCEFSPMHIFFI